MGKPKFSFEKHKDTGAKLKSVHKTLQTLDIEVANSYPHASKASRLAAKATDAIDKLRCELDSQLFKDCPVETSRDESKPTHVYYGEAPHEK